MKTRSFPDGLAAAGVALFLVSAPVFAAVPAVATPAPAGGPEVAKTHTLFMGVDLSVAQQKQFYRVRDVSGGSFVIDVNGRPVFVQMNAMFGAPINLRVDQSLKLSRVSATLDRLKGERGYMPGTDPRRVIAQEQIAVQTAISDRSSMAEHVLADSAASTGRSMFVAGVSDTLRNVQRTGQAIPGIKLKAGEGLDASAVYDRAQQATHTVGGTDKFAQRLEAALAKELYDAMWVDFEVTSEQPLNNPYVVLITRFHEKGAKPGAAQNWIYAKSLEPIADRPEKVHVLQGGFPPGFILEEFQVHLFNQGLEIASNVAPKRVPLTADEAMLYLMIEYLTAHKTDTVKASPALTTLPADFQARLARGEGKVPLYVKVSKEGRISDAFLDEACTTKFDDPYFASAIRDIRFKPALEKGKPVDSVARLKLTDLPQSL